MLQVNNMIMSMPIIITTRKQQVRKHKKKRINKKWLKRYGVVSTDVQPDDKIIHLEGKLYMTERCYWNLKDQLNGGNSCLR